MRATGASKAKYALFQYFYRQNTIFWARNTDQMTVWHTTKETLTILAVFETIGPLIGGSRVLKKGNFPVNGLFLTL